MAGLPHYITDASGRTQSIAAWTRELGLSGKAIAKRLRLGWPPEVAVTRSPG